MEGILKILPILIPPIPLTDDDRKEFSEAEEVVKMWPTKQTKYFKNVKGKKRITSDSHNLRIKTLLKNTSYAAQNTLEEGIELGIWPEALRDDTPTVSDSKPAKVSSRPVNGLPGAPGTLGARQPEKKENEQENSKRLERRRAEMLEYDRRMAEREAQEDKEERDRERRIEAHRMSQIRAEQLKTMVYAKSRLLRPDREGIRLKWERRAVKC